MFTPSLIIKIGSNPNEYRGVLVKLASTINNKARGGSLKLRRYVKRGLHGIATMLSEQDARYLANESNYLWLKNFGKMEFPTSSADPERIKPAREVPAKKERFMEEVKVEAQPKISTPKEVVNKPNSMLMNDSNSTAAWVNNTLLALSRLGGRAARYISGPVIRNLLAAEVGAGHTSINPRKANGIGYMGAFQMGLSEWAANRRHGITDFTAGVNIADKASGHRITTIGAAGGPSDVKTAPAVWARYISKVVRNIPDQLLSKNPIDAVYLYHNLGSGNAVEIFKVGQKGSISARAAWAAITQLGYISRGEGRKYVVSLAKVRRTTSSNHRPLRAMMAAITASGHPISEASFKELLISRVRNSAFAPRLIA